MVERSLSDSLRASVFLAAVLAAGEAAAQTVTDPSLTLTTVTTGSRRPRWPSWGRATSRLQKANGQVRRVLNGVLQPGFVLDFPVNSEAAGPAGIAVNADPRRCSCTPRPHRKRQPHRQPGLPVRLERGRGHPHEPDPVLNLPVTTGPNHDGKARPTALTASTRSSATSTATASSRTTRRAPRPTTPP
jgi:hypothetical protein